jgi:hypothetical protein
VNGEGGPPPFAPPESLTHPCICTIGTFNRIVNPVAGALAVEARAVMPESLAL